MLARVWRKNERIFRFVVQSLLPGDANVDDVLQDAFVRVLQARSRFESERDAFNFLRKTVVTTSIDHYRYWRRRRHILEGDPPCCDDVQISDGHDPLDRLLRSEQKRVRELLLCEVREALQSLPEEQREAIRIVFSRNGRKIKEICIEVGIPYSTLRSRMQRGIHKIRAHLSRRGLLQQPGRVGPQ